MNFFLDGIAAAWQLIVSGDPYIVGLVGVSLQVAIIPTLIAMVIGVPIALVLGLDHSRARRAGLAVANAGLGLPPVVVGLVLALLMFSRAPLADLHLLFTLNGVLLAQTLLALPIIVALIASALRAVPVGLLDQARVLRASRPQVAWLALREARVGVLTAIIVAVGSGLSEVGAVVLVGGNIQGTDQTLASAALQAVDAGDFTTGVAIGIVLLALIALVAAALTVVQYGGRTRRRHT